MQIDAAFKAFTKHKSTRDRYQIDCIKGLWGVDAPTKEQAMNEARNYFRQYYADGEYTLPGSLLNDLRLGKMWPKQ